MPRLVAFPVILLGVGQLLGVECFWSPGNWPASPISLSVDMCVLIEALKINARCIVSASFTLHINSYFEPTGTKVRHEIEFGRITGWTAIELTRHVDCLLFWKNHPSIKLVPPQLADGRALNSRKIILSLGYFSLWLSLSQRALSAALVWLFFSY